MSEEAKTRPLAAVGVIIRNAEGKILVGERLSSHGDNTYQIPGGHLEHGETFEEAARKEVMEETGLTDIVFVGLVSVNNERVYRKHYVNVGFLVDLVSGEPGNPEPEKSRNWNWYDPNDLPQPMFPSSENVVKAWLTGVLMNEVEKSA